MRSVKMGLAILLFTGMAAAQASIPGWRSFDSRTGWSIQYPSNWKTRSCQSCQDAHAAGVYVDFFPPSNSEHGSWVVVEPLAPKPVDTTVSAWLANIAATANLNVRLLEQKLFVDGRPALRVRYRTSDGSCMEAVYVISGSETFSIGFTGDDVRPPLENLPNYQIFNTMVHSFRLGAR